MPVITRIAEQHDTERISVYIDGTFCTGIRKRTFQAMNLQEGDKISCEELKENENFFWKHAYKDVWRQEKERINKVASLVQDICENALIKIVGFGANSETLIKEHPDEKGKPDIDVMQKGPPGTAILKIEVTGTQRMRGIDFWIRPDKLQYAEKHPEEDVWIILHFAKPKEIFVFIKPVMHRKYERHTKNIRGAGEIFCVFKPGDEEIRSLEEFSFHLKQKMARSK